MKEHTIIFQIKDTDQCGPTNGTHFFCDSKDISETQSEDDINKTIHKTKNGCGLLPSKSASLWMATSSDEIVGDVGIENLPETVDVLVIGGGMAGILTAYQLKQKGVNVIVVERNYIGTTCTANTTAKITSLHGSYYSKITKSYGEEKAKKYYEIQEKAIQEYEKLIEQYDISCSFEKKSHILYTTKDEEKLHKEYECFKQLNIPVDYIKDAPIPVGIIGGIVFQNQAQFHPLKFLHELAKQISVFNLCQVTQIESDGTVTINHQKRIKAQSIVMATHYPIINSKGMFFTKLHQQRSYVVALDQKAPFHIHDMYIDYDEAGHSFRTYDKLLLMGLGNHRTGTKSVPDYYKQLEGESSRWFPDARIVYEWSNQDCMSIDHIPYIGQYSKTLPNVYVATGFNQWGMSSSMVSSLILSDLITKGKNQYSDVFDPSRSMLSGTGKLLVNGGVSVKNLTKQIMHLKEDDLKQIKNGEAGIVKLEGKVVGVYKDENGDLHAIDTKCTHLGCRLQWNQNDKTWDCPCHGSRFDIEGNLIEDPAEKNLNSVCTLKSDDKK